MSLPDTFRSPGVALVRVGGYVKVALATEAKLLDVTVRKLRVPEAIASLAEGDATERFGVLVGAFVTGSPHDLAETVLREAERLTGTEAVAGDYVRIHEDALETVIRLVEGRLAGGAEFVRYGEPVPYRVSSYEVDLEDRPGRRASRTEPSPVQPVSRVEAAWIKPPAPRRVDLIVSADEARAVREQRERETALAESRARTHAAYAAEAARRPAGSEAPGGCPTKSRIYTAARTVIYSTRERATRAQFSQLLQLGATVDVSLADFTHRVTRRDASSAIDTQKAGVRQVMVAY